MLLVFLAVGFLEALHNIRNVLGAVSIGDEQGIRGIYDDEIVDSNGGNEGTLGMDVAVGRVLQDCIVVGVVAVFVAWCDLP